MTKPEIVTTKQDWLRLKALLSSDDFASLVQSTKALISRAKDACLFEVAELKYGVAYCYNYGSKSGQLLKIGKDNTCQSVIARAFIEATSELSAGDILGSSEVTNESVRVGQTSGAKATKKTSIKIAIGK